MILVAVIAVRDLPAYFVEWPKRGMTRFLYRADVHDVADYLNQRPEIENFGITGLLAGPWDRIALTIDLDKQRAATAKPRWYNPERALLLVPDVGFGGFPDVASPFKDSWQPVSNASSVGGYQLYQIADERTQEISTTTEPVCFQNGLCWVSAQYDDAARHLELEWLVQEAIDLPPIPLISNPPPPGVYSGPRLSVFAQLQNADGEFLVGDDGLWVDPTTLQPGDRFVQQHQFTRAQDAAVETAVFGLYDPFTGDRILTLNGQDHIRLEVGE